MKNYIFKTIFIVFFLLFMPQKTFAEEFNVLVLPTDIFNVCDNYYCFPEPSNIAAKFIIKDLQTFKGINTYDLSSVRTKISANSELKTECNNMLNTFEDSDQIDFQVLSKLSKEFNVKSITLISSNVNSENTSTHRNIWETLEISSAFDISHRFNLNTKIVLTDTVNSVVMWSNKYNKTLSNNNDKFYAKNYTQAVSQLEKLNQYFKSNISKNVSQNVNLRFFPKDVKTLTSKNNIESESSTFRPNALDGLTKPKLLRELNDGNDNTQEDFIYEF